MRFRTAAVTVVIYAVAMAYLESAVVVYLQRALGINPDNLFSLHAAEVAADLAAIEAGRELATIVMLAAVGILVGRRWVDRLAWTAAAFGVWDVFYYVWLWVFIGWPHSLNTWDVLFLVPVPWAGPVWAPIAVSIALVVFGLAAARRVGRGEAVQVGLMRGFAAVIGGIVVVLSFTANATALLEGEMPAAFPWPVFVAGMAIAVWAAFASLHTRGAS